MSVKKKRERRRSAKEAQHKAGAQLARISYQISIMLGGVKCFTKTLSTLNCAESGDNDDGEEEEAWVLVVVVNRECSAVLNID